MRVLELSISKFCQIFNIMSLFDYILIKIYDEGRQLLFSERLFRRKSLNVKCYYTCTQREEKADAKDQKYIRKKRPSWKCLKRLKRNVLTQKISQSARMTRTFVVNTFGILKIPQKLVSRSILIGHDINLILISLLSDA